MKDNALGVANYFIELAQKDKKDLTQLGLMKRVYIAHGFSLAIHQKSLLDARFDRVEAWKYGPVIPSVYHSFKQYKADPITEKTVVMGWDEKKCIPTFDTPKLEDKDAQKIVAMVWKRYSDMTDADMVTLTHKKGSPWDMCYIPDKNEAIPDEITEWYYKRIVDAFIAKHENQ